MSEEIKSDSFLADVSYKGEKFIFKHAQDIDPYLKVANMQRKNEDTLSRYGNMRKVASIPALMYEKIIKEDPELEHNHEKLLKKVLELKEKGLDFTTVERI